MAISNPLILLPVSGDISLDDLYDEKLFEFRQFFTRQLPTTKLFHSKLKKLKQYRDAFLMLGGSENDLKQFTHIFEGYDNDNVKNTVLIYQKESSTLRLAMNSSQSYQSIENVALQMLDNYGRYAECWRLEKKLDTYQIKLSDELDAMSMLQALVRFNDDGKTTFEELKRMSDKNVLYKEAIRLSLWLNFENNV